MSTPSSSATSQSSSVSSGRSSTAPDPEDRIAGSKLFTRKKTEDVVPEFEIVRAPAMPIIPNSYVLEPKAGKRFRVIKVKCLIKKFLDMTFKGKQYNKDECTALTKTLVVDIKNKLKDCGYVRYKLMVQVVICELKGQGFTMSARALYDQRVDNFAQIVYKNETLVCAVCCMGVYFY